MLVRGLCPQHGSSRQTAIGLSSMTVPVWSPKIGAVASVLQQGLWWLTAELDTRHPEVLRCCPKTGAQVLGPCATGAKNVSVLKVCNFRAVSLVSVNRLPVVVLRDETWSYLG